MFAQAPACPLAFWQRLQGRLFAPECTLGLGLFRILFGAYLAWYFLRYIGSIELLFSNQGVYAPFLFPDYAPSAATARVMVGAAVLTAGALTVGWKSRVMAVLMLALYLYHFFLGLGATGYSYDRLNILLLLLLALGNSGACLSLDAWMKGTSWQTDRGAATLIRAEIALMYLGSGLFKLTNPAWRDGDIIRFSLAGGWATDLSTAILRLDLPTWLYDVTAWSVIMFELIMGPLLLAQRTAVFAAALGLCFHLLIWFLFGIPEFLQVVAAYVLFIPIDRVQVSHSPVVMLTPRGSSR